jgi:twitching motility protein PilT
MVTLSEKAYLLLCYSENMTNSSFPSLASLNRDPAITDTLAALSRPGLVLVCGSTGSGKSTTLAAMGADLQRNGFKVNSVRTMDNEVIPGLPEIVRYSFADRSIIRAVLGVHQPDVVIIDNLSSVESYKFAVDLAAKDALVIVSLHAQSAEDAVRRMVDGYPDADGDAAVSAAMIMSIHQKMVPAKDNEYNAAHWAAVGRAENLLSMANPYPRPPFAYREDRKVETSIRTYAPAR